MSSSAEHYGDKQGLLVMSHNAIVSEVVSNRNYGKTWAFKKRAFRRAMKHGKKTIWIRLFKKEQQEAVASFYSSSDLQRYCGISMYDKDSNPNGNCKQIGNTFYYRYKVGRRWHWFMKIFKMSDAGALRSADDVNVDTIVYDELMKTPNEYMRYRGDLATQFCDIFLSIKREHKVRIIILGNKEGITNPINNYFNIKPLPKTFEGIKRYRNGSFVIQQINNKQKETTSYDRQVRDLLSGTPYGNYLYEGDYKQGNAFKMRKTPATATIYCQLILNNQPLKISAYNGYFYVNSKIDTSRHVYCDVLPHKYKQERLLVKRQKRFFVAYINALADNIVYYDSEASYETAQRFRAWLNV